MVSEAFKRSINMVQIFSPLSKAFLHFSNITSNKCCATCHFLKPDIYFDNLSHI